MAPDEPNTLWVTCPAHQAERANIFVQEQLGKPGGFDQEADAKLVLSPEQAQLLQQHIGKDSTGQPWVEIIPQCHGDLVVMPPGHLHQVVNQQPCVKMAWDYYKLEQFPYYVASWQYVASKVTCHNAADYLFIFPWR